MTRETITYQIEDIISTLLEKKQSIDLDKDLWEVGLDSIKTVELLILLESEYNLKLRDEDMNIDNFTSLNSIINLIESYL